MGLNNKRPSSRLRLASFLARQIRVQPEPSRRGGSRAASEKLKRVNHRRAAERHAEAKEKALLFFLKNKRLHKDPLFGLSAKERNSRSSIARFLARKGIVKGLSEEPLSHILEELEAEGEISLPKKIGKNDNKRPYLSKKK